MLRPNKVQTRSGWQQETIGLILAFRMYVFPLELLSLSSETDSCGSTYTQSITNYLLIKKLHFGAVAQYRKSVDDLGANRCGDSSFSWSTRARNADEELENFAGMVMSWEDWKLLMDWSRRLWPYRNVVSLKLSYEI